MNSLAVEDGVKKSSLPRWLRIVLIGRNPKITLIRIVIIVALIFAMRAYVVLPVRVQGPSMLPTYQVDGVNFVNRLAYLRHEPQRGDIVAIRFSDEHIMMVKRVLGLPGETVALHDGRVMVNGELLDEPYVIIPGDRELAPETLGPSQYFVIGDNRAVTVFGKADRKRIVGKILLLKNIFASSSRRL
jgi:signal peptidase I